MEKMTAKLTSTPAIGATLSQGTQEIRHTLDKHVAGQKVTGSLTLVKVTQDSTTKVLTIA